MAEMDGMELVRRLHAQYPELPIILVSADVQRATRDEALAAGALAFVAKVSDPAEIVEAVRTVVGRRPLGPLTPAQHDAFTEMMNIAMGQAAQALSSLLERHVQLQVPRVQIMHASELEGFLEREAPEIGALVRQKFSGPLNGASALVFPRQHAVVLIRVLLGTARELEQLSAAEQTVLAEVGNVVLNAALARLADQIGVRVRVALPTVFLNQSAAEAARLILSSAPQADHAMVLLSLLRIGSVDLSVYLVVALPGADVQRLLESLGVSAGC